MRLRLCVLTQRFGHINIVLDCRNIIEKSYSDTVLKRREVEANQQDGLLREFNAAKEGSWSEERRQRQTLAQHGNVNVILGLCIIIIALLILLALVSVFSML